MTLQRYHFSPEKGKKLNKKLLQCRLLFVEGIAVISIPHPVRDASLGRICRLPILCMP